MRIRLTIHKNCNGHWVWYGRTQGLGHEVGFAATWCRSPRQAAEHYRDYFMRADEYMALGLA